MEFRFELASAADDADIRRMLAANPMPGDLVLGYEREPSYWVGASLLSSLSQVVVARHPESGELAGVACRSVRPVWVNGEEREVGYLSQLRVAPRFRGRWLLSRGWRFMRELDAADGRVPGYFATIIEGNREAEAVLVAKPRPGYPVWRALDRLATVAVLVGRPLSSAGFDVAPASEAEWPAVAAFLRQHGRQRQFFPAAGFGPGELPGLTPSEWLLARRGGELVGVTAVWDQSGFKQTVVRGYGGVWRWARGPVNVLARLSGGAPPLPPVGSQLRQAYAAFFCVADDDPAVAAALLRAAYNRAAALGLGYLLVGLSVRDPLLAVVKRYRHVTYYSKLYSLTWKDGGAYHEQLDQRIPYVEIAGL